MRSIIEVSRYFGVQPTESIIPMTKILNQLEQQGIKYKVTPPTEMSRPNFSLETINGEKLITKDSRENCLSWQSSAYQACITLLNSISGKKLVTKIPDYPHTEYAIPKFDTLV